MSRFISPRLCGPLSLIKIVEKKTTKTHKKLVRESLHPQKNSWSSLARLMQCSFHSKAVRSSVRCCSSRKCKKIVTKAKKSNAVHFLIVLWFIYTRCEVHSTFSFLKKLRLNKRNHAVLLPVRCSAVFRPLQCGFQSDEVPTSIWVSRKTECPHFGKFKTALKPQGIRESVLYEKVVCRRYLSNVISFESFRRPVCKIFTKNGRCHSLSAARFSKLT